jgi:hypothetical protein
MHLCSDVKVPFPQPRFAALLPSRSKSGTPTAFSSSNICRLTADADMFNLREASRIEPDCVTATK